MVSPKISCLTYHSLAQSTNLIAGDKCSSVIKFAGNLYDDNAVQMFVIKKNSYLFQRKSHCGDKMVLNRLISTVGFPILLRWHLYIEPGPGSHPWLQIKECMLITGVTDMGGVGLCGFSWCYGATSRNPWIKSDFKSAKELYLECCSTDGEQCGSIGDTAIWLEIINQLSAMQGSSVITYFIEILYHDNTVKKKFWLVNVFS